MKHMNIFNSAIYGMSGVSQQLQAITKFCATNRNVRIPIPDMTDIFKTKVLSTTPISSAFDNALQAKKLTEIFAGINVPSNYSTPESMSMSHITLDVLQLKEFDKRTYKALAVFPEFQDKIIINITHLLKKKIKGAVSDMNELQSLFVRGLLTRSYFTSHNWLTPSLIKYLSKSYSMTISSTIARNYDLTISDQNTIATILTAYFQSLCYSDTKDGEFPVTINDCEYLGRRFDIISTLDDIKEKLEGSTEMDIVKVCELISKSGPSRLEKFDTRAFYTICQRLGNDHLSTLLALEYPPYWAHQILLSVSGVKSGLFFAMKKQGRLVQEGKLFADTLNRASSFIPAL